MADLLSNVMMLDNVYKYVASVTGHPMLLLDLQDLRREVADLRLTVATETADIAFVKSILALPEGSARDIVVLRHAAKRAASSATAYDRSNAAARRRNEDIAARYNKAASLLAVRVADCTLDELSPDALNVAKWAVLTLLYEASRVTYKAGPLARSHLHQHAARYTALADKLSRGLIADLDDACLIGTAYSDLDALANKISIDDALLRLEHKFFKLTNGACEPHDVALNASYVDRDVLTKPEFEKLGLSEFVERSKQDVPYSFTSRTPEESRKRLLDKIDTAILTMSKLMKIPVPPAIENSGRPASAPKKHP